MGVSKYFYTCIYRMTYMYKWMHNNIILFSILSTACTENYVYTCEIPTEQYYTMEPLVVTHIWFESHFCYICSIFDSQLLPFYSHNEKSIYPIILYRHFPLQYRCISVPWWAATTPGRGTEPEPWRTSGTGCGRGTVPCTRWVHCIMVELGTPLHDPKLTQHFCRA